MKTKQSSKPNRASPPQKLNGKVAPAPPAKDDAARWKQQCAKMRRERDQLRRQVAELRAQRAEYSQMICDVVCPGEKFDFDKEALLAQVGELPSLKDLIEELAQPESADQNPGNAKKKAPAGKRV